MSQSSSSCTRKMSPVFLILACFLQISLSSELNTLFVKNADSVIEILNRGFDAYQNISQVAVSSIPRTRSRGPEYLEDIVDEYSEQYQELKNKAEAEGVDIGSCLDYFEFEHVKTAYLDLCFDRKIDDYITAASEKQNKFWEHYLTAFYRLALYLTDFKELEEKPDFWRKRIGETLNLGVAYEKYFLHSDMKDLLTKIKDVDGCVEDFAKVIKDEQEANFLGFQTCVVGITKMKKDRIEIQL